eukprot:47223-Pleurochrysis_carterae.AAC.2
MRACATPRPAPPFPARPAAWHAAACPSSAVGCARGPPASPLPPRRPRPCPGGEDGLTCRHPR